MDKANDILVLSVGCTVIYFDNVSKIWLVSKIALHTYDREHFIETDEGRLISNNRHDPLPEE